MKKRVFVASAISLLALITVSVPILVLYPQINISFCKNIPDEVNCGDILDLCAKVNVLNRNRGFYSVKLSNLVWENKGCSGRFEPSSQGKEVTWRSPSNVSHSPISCTLKVTVRATITVLNLFSWDTYEFIEHEIQILPMHSMSFLPNSSIIDVNRFQQVKVNIPYGAPANSFLSLTPDNSHIAVNNAKAGNRVTVPVSDGSTSETITIRGISVGTSILRATMSCFNSANITVRVAPPSPRVQLSINSQQAAIVWGQTATFTVTVEGEDGFSGAVNLTLENAPFGITHSFAPDRVNVPQNRTAMSTLSLSTAEAGTKLILSPLRIRATPQIGSVASVTANLTLNLLRSPGSFNAVTLTTNSSFCGSVTATVVPMGSGLGVEFTGSPFGRTRPNAVVEFFRNPGLSEPQGYAISSQCRVGVVRAPISHLNEHYTSFWNLGFDPAIGANGLGNMAHSPVKGPFIKAFFSQDNSLCLIITAANQQLTGHIAAAGLLDLGRGTIIGPTNFFTGVINSVTLDVRTVTLNFTDPQSRAQSLTWTVP